MMRINLDNGLSLNYEVYGTGQRLLLLHGWGADLHSFDNIVPELSKNFQTLLVDLPGFGQSSTLPHPFDIHDYVQSLEGFLATLEINNTAVLGHSFGGAVGIKMAVSSRRLSQLILEDSSGIRNKNLQTRFKIRIYKTLKPFLNEMQREWIRQVLGSTDYKNSGVLRDTLVKVTNEDLRSVLAQVRLPTLLIWGEKDMDTPSSHAKIFKDKIKNSELHIIEGAGHFPHLDKPREFITTITEFLTEIRIKRV